MAFPRQFLLARSAANQVTLAQEITNLGSVTIATAAASPSNSNILSFASVTSIFPGFTAAAAGIPAGDVISVVNVGSSDVTLANTVTGTIASGGTVTLSTTGTVNGLVNSGSVIVMNDVSQLSTIMSVTGSNIAGGSTIAAFSTVSSDITLSANVSGTIANKEVLTFSFKRATNAQTLPGGDILTFGSGAVNNLATGMSVNSGALFPAGATISNIDTVDNNITLSTSAINNVGSGAAITFGSPSFVGSTVTPFANALSDTQTVLHLDFDSARDSKFSMSASSLLNFGSAVANEFAQSSDLPTTLQSVSALNNKIGVDLIVNI